MWLYPEQVGRVRGTFLNMSMQITIVKHLLLRLGSLRWMNNDTDDSASLSHDCHNGPSLIQRCRTRNRRS